MSMQMPVSSLDVLMPGCFDTSQGTPITGLCSDSRKVEAGNLFFALEGYSRRGSEFAQDAIDLGAAAIASNDPFIREMSLGIPVYFDKDLSQKTSIIAGRFYQHPSENMDVIGITGTNGKTSCCYWLTWILGRSGVTTGHIGTLGAGMGIHENSLVSTGFTTPDALQSQRLLAECRQAGAEAVVMEVSSHGLDQGRVAAVRFESAIFTNLSQDHLDYHEDMQGYLAAKLKLFERSELKRAIINLDDTSCDQIKSVLHDDVELYTYSLRNTNTDIYFSDIQIVASGYQVTLSGRWGAAELLIPVFGEYNLSNVLAVSAAAIAKGVSFDRVVELLRHVPDVPGRMQYLSVPSAPSVVIDYAHTPDAVSSALQALRPQVKGQLTAVVGCGGERDTEKRPLMALAAARYSDRQIFTSDNPRSESPTKILNEMLAGLDGLDRASRRCARVIEDRKEAIEAALESAGDLDMVAVLGKGHENQQIIGTETIEFNDADVCQEILAELASERAAT